MIYSKKEIKDKLLSLNEPTRDAVTSLENFEFVINLGKNHNLSDDKAKELYNEMTWVLLGFKKNDDFKDNIKILADNNDDVAIKISEEIKERIFNPVLESINNPNSTQLNKEEEKVSSSIVQNVPNNPEAQPFDVPATVQEEKKQIVDMPNYSNYDSGKDPYREPLE